MRTELPVSAGTRILEQQLDRVADRFDEAFGGPGRVHPDMEVGLGQVLFCGTAPDRPPRHVPRSTEPCGA